MTAEEYFGDWIKVIDRNVLNHLLNTLNDLYKTKNIYPKKSLVFKAFRLCKLSDLKALMLFQDPYFQKDIATGIALGNSIDTPENKLSPSLQVIKEAVINFEVPHNCINFDPTLESWESQGVLLLNSALTVEEGRPNSHSIMWREFIKRLLLNLSEYNSGIIYALFGDKAKSFKDYIDSRHNYIYTEYHPAYYVRNNMKMPGTIFQKINNKMYDLYGTKIDWYKEYE